MVKEKNPLQYKSNNRGRPKTSDLSRDEQLRINSRVYRQKKRNHDSAINSLIKNTLILGIDAALNTMKNASFADNTAWHETISILTHYQCEWKKGLKELGVEKQYIRKIINLEILNGGEF